MNFNNILNDTKCECLVKTKQDITIFFARKINKPLPLEKDFISHWERGKRADDCKGICGFKGLSINEWNKKTEMVVINKFLTTFAISPKHKDSILIFKFLPNAGLIKHTPTKEDKAHYDFYKSDEFTLEMLENYNIIPLKDFINNE